MLTQALWSQSQQLMQYASEEYGYSVRIPEDWIRKDDVRSDRIAMVLIGPENASMSIVFHVKAPSYTREQFVNQYRESTFVAKENFLLEEKGMLASRDDAAPYLVVEYSEDGEEMRGKICFYEKSGEIGVVSLIMNKKAFHKELPRIDAILKSFTFETDQEKVEEKR